MSAARFFCAMTALGICLLHGKVCVARAVGRTAEMQDMIEDLMSVDRMIRLERLSLADIASRLAQNGRCRSFWRSVDSLTSQGTPFREAIRKAELPDMGKNAVSALLDYASDIGSNDLEAEGTRLSCVIERMNLALSELKEHDRDKARLTMKLSALLGAAAAILII